MLKTLEKEETSTGSLKPLKFEQLEAQIPENIKFSHGRNLNVDGRKESSIIDLPLTKVDGNLVKLVSWYDNDEKS